MNMPSCQWTSRCVMMASLVGLSPATIHGEAMAVHTPSGAPPMTALAVLLALSHAPIDAALAKNAHEILMKHCSECHSNTNPRGGINVMDWPKLRASGVVSKKPGESELVLLVEAGNMPPGETSTPS